MFFKVGPNGLDELYQSLKLKLLRLVQQCNKIFQKKKSISFSYLFKSCPKTKKKEHTGQCDQYLKTCTTEDHKVMNPQGVKISVATRNFLFRVSSYHNFIKLSVTNI